MLHSMLCASTAQHFTICVHNRTCCPALYILLRTVACTRTMLSTGQQTGFYLRSYSINTPASGYMQEAEDAEMCGEGGSLI